LRCSELRAPATDAAVCDLGRSHVQAYVSIAQRRRQRERAGACVSSINRKRGRYRAIDGRAARNKVSIEDTASPATIPV
jgi:hypothetical protein